MTSKEVLCGGYSLKDIPVLLPPPGVPYDGNRVTPEDMGKDDANTIHYINVKTNQIPPGHEKRIKELENMMDLTHRWLDIQSGIHTKKQKEAGRLPTDIGIKSQLIRDDYRIKVINTILAEGNCNWLVVSKIHEVEYRIQVKKADFHLEIVKDIMKGITTVASISKSIEDVLVSMFDITAKAKNNMENHFFWSWFNVFTWDEVTEEVKPTIRIVYYRVSEDMVEYCINKAKYQQVNMAFDFSDGQYTFVDSLWVMYQDAISKFIYDYGDIKIRDPIDGEIIP
ncbi:hypothetical protein F4805DRAFT_473572 [Annulohypoxylon moriforme]|nr:hypothetical protein F4805DRAFT_473572 [Annulohypoxylon moriforme]